MLMAGPLAGTPAIACSRLVVSGKSPLLMPDQYGHATMGGSSAPALKGAGFDGLVITGKADRTRSACTCQAARFALMMPPVCGDLTHTQPLKNCSSSTATTCEPLCIGPAGERLVRFALIVGKESSCAGHGFGALMGSKNIKAIVFQPDGKVPVARPEELKEINRTIRGLIKGRQLMEPMIDGIELVRRAPCKGCPAGCARSIYRHVSGTVEHRKLCASVFFYSDWEKVYNKGEPGDQSFLATSACDKIGICTAEVHKNARLAAMPALNRVLSLQKKPDCPLMKSAASVFLTHICRHYLSAKASAISWPKAPCGPRAVIGRGTEKLLENTLSSEGFSARLYNGRYFITTALFHATDPTNPMAQLHEVCYPLFKWVLWYATDGDHVER